MFLFFIGLALVIQGLIDTRNFRDDIIQIIQLQTNRKVTIKGPVSITFLPVPTLHVPGLELREQQEGKKPAPILSIGMMSIRVSLLSVLSEKPEITSISLDRVALEMVRGEDRLIYWDWLNPDLLKSMANDSAPDRAITLQVTNSRIILRDLRTEGKISFENLNFIASNGSKLYLGGSLMFYGHLLKFNLNTNGVSNQTPKGEFPFDFSMTSTDTSTMQLKGMIDLSGDLPVLKGSVAMDLEDASRWLQPMAEEDNRLITTVTNKFEKETGKVLRPIKLSGDWTQDGLTVDVANVRIEGLNSGGIGDISLKWKSWQPVIAANLTFSVFDYNQWETVLGTVFNREDSGFYRRMYSDEDGPGSPLPQDVVFSLDIKANELYIGGQSWKNATLSAEMGDAAITVNQFGIELPGDSTLTLFGVISPAATGDLRFEGSMETRGKSLRNLLTVFDDSAADLPETGMGGFYAHSNIFVSSKQLRMSEADVKLGDLRLNGGLVFYFDEQPRVEADVKLKNINFDYFRDAWRLRESKNVDKGKDFFLKYDKTMSFNWLKNLRTTIDFRVNVEKFTFLEHSGTSASFRIYARYGDFGIYDINFIYPTDVMRGTFRLDVNQEKPLATLSLSASEINTSYFTYSPPSQEKLLEEEEEGEKPAGPDKEKSQEKDKDKGKEDAKPAAKGDKGKPEGDKDGGKGETDSELKAIPAKPEKPETKAAPPEPASGKAVKPGKEQESDKAAPDTAEKPAAKPAEKPAAKAPEEKPGEKPTEPSAAKTDKKLVLDPQSEKYTLLAQNEDIETVPRPATSVEDLMGRQRYKIDSTLGGGKLSELIDMSWLNGWAGNIDLNVNKLVHKDITLNNFRIQANFANDLLTFKTLTFSYWGGECSVAGSLYGGKVPGMSISLAFLNGNLNEILDAITGRKNVNGSISVSATVNTSGVNYLSWIQQAEGKIAIVGRGVAVKGFNLKGVVDAVNISRTASDVVNSVNQAMVNGNTTFAVDGNLNIKNGMMRTPGMNLRSENIQGNLMGEVRMLQWSMDLTTMFQFPEMSSETIPTMTVQLSGPLEEGELRADTASLEAYVAKRIISK